MKLFNKDDLKIIIIDLKNIENPFLNYYNICVKMNWLITSQPYKELNMKAATYLSTGNLQLIDKPKPVIIKPTDAIVQLVKTTLFVELICIS